MKKRICLHVLNCTLQWKEAASSCTTVFLKWGKCMIPSLLPEIIDESVQVSEYWLSAKWKAFFFFFSCGKCHRVCMGKTVTRFYPGILRAPLNTLLPGPEIHPGSLLQSLRRRREEEQYDHRHVSNQDDAQQCCGCSQWLRVTYPGLSCHFILVMEREKCV